MATAAARATAPRTLLTNQIDRRLAWSLTTLKTARIDHPVLHFPASGVTIAGYVELREESQHTDRFVLRVDRIDGARMEIKPQRVRRPARIKW